MDADERRRVVEAGQGLATVPPFHVYRYFPLSSEQRWGFLEDLLLRDSLYFACPAEFEDPADCRLPEIDFSGSDKEWEEYWRALLGRLDPWVPWPQREGKILLNVVSQEHRNPKFQRGFRKGVEQDTLKNTGVVCFTDCGRGERFWNEYASGGNGVCVRFLRDMAVDDALFRHLRRVKYLDERRIHFRASPVTWINQTLLTKLRAFDWEQEFRIVINLQGLQHFTPTIIDGLTLGPRLPLDSRKRVRKLLEQRRTGTVGIWEAVPGSIPGCLGVRSIGTVIPEG